MKVESKWTTMQQDKGAVGFRPAFWNVNSIIAVILLGVILPIYQSSLYGGTRHTTVERNLGPNVVPEVTTSMSRTSTEGGFTPTAVRSSYSSAGTNFWMQTNGPNGGCISLAVNSDGWIFAGTAGGGVYLSTDDGNTWTPSTLVNNKVYSLLTTSSGYVYAGVDQGIYISTDNGNSWIQKDFTGANDAVISLAINSAGYIFAGTYSSFYVSTDGGNTWVQSNSGLPGPVNSVSINSSGYIFAGATSGGVYLSTDNGSTWTQKGLSGYTVQSLLINASGYLFAGTNTGGVYVSTDNGGTWTQHDSGMGSSSIAAIAVNSSGDIFAGTYGEGVYLSTDGGISWVQKNTGLAAGSQITSLAVSGSGYLFANNGLAVYISTDDGGTWVQKNSGLKSSNIYSIATNSSGDIFAGKWGGGIYASTDSGETWVNAGMANGWIQAEAINASGYIFAGTNGGGVYVSTDNGHTWVQKNSGLSNNNVWSLAIDSSGYLFAGTNGGGVYLSTDDGNSWTQKNFTTSTVMSLAINPSGYVFAGTSSEGIYLSTDNGGTWTQQNSGLPMASGGAVTSISINSRGYIFAAVWGQGVYVSADTGNTWTKSLTDNYVYTNSIVSNLSGSVFVGDRQGGGISFSTDNGSSWSVNNSGLTSGYIYSLTVDPLGHVYVGTFGGGVYRSVQSTDLPPTPPSLVGPANGSTVDSASPLLVWNASRAATSYILQLSTDPNFGSFEVNQLIRGDTSYTASGLLGNTTYYWRAEAVNGGGASAWSSVWSFTTRASGLRNVCLTSNGGVATAISVGTYNGVTRYVSYANDGDSATSWADAGDMPAWLVVKFDSAYVINGVGVWWGSHRQHFLISLSRDSTNWSTAVSSQWSNNSEGSGPIHEEFPISPQNAKFIKIYIDSTSAPTSQIFQAIVAELEAFTDTSAIGIPVQPSLFFPADGSQAIALNTGIKWHPSAGATSYTLQLSADSSFATTTYDSAGIQDTSITVSGLQPLTKYYWRVNASDSLGTSGWSDLWSFTTIIGAPSRPTLASPTNGSSGVPTNPVFSWNPLSGATSYRLELSTDSSFATTTYDSAGIQDTSITVNGLQPLTKYYWRVNASDAAGTSEWSAVDSFTTERSVLENVCLAANGGVATAISVGTYIGVTRYASYVNDGDSATSWADNGNMPAWIVVKFDSLYDIGMVGIWWGSHKQHFSVSLSPDSTNWTTAVSPQWSINTEGSAPVHQLFTINPTEARYIKIYIDSTSAPSGQIFQAIVAELQAFTGTNPSGVPIAPTLIAPNGSLNNEVGTDPVLSWNASGGPGVTYALQVATHEDFSVLVVDKSGLTSLFQQITGLATGTVYYWRVNATDSAGTSLWSIGSFMTFSYPANITVSDQFIPPGTSDQSNYMMIGLPGAADIPVSSLFSGNEGTDWEAYYDNGAPQNYQVKDDGSSTFDFSPGHALWIFSKNSFSVSQSASTVPLDTGDCYSIPLHGGWNLISDPFERSVPWSEVQSLNGVTQPIYSYNGNYSTSTSFDPYTGYYFYNDQTMTSLRIPYVYNSASQNSPAKFYGKVSSIQDNIITLSLLTSRYESLPVNAGFDPAVSDTLNRRDIFAPPDNFTSIGMEIVDPNVRGYWKNLYSDFRNDIGKGQVFDIEVKNLTGQTATLKPLVTNGFADYDVYLVDNGTHSFYDLKTTDSVSISGSYKYKSYSLLVGNGDFIDSVRAVYAPKTFQLYQNYPNPFNPTTIIRYEIPKKAQVTLQVYNVLGELVRTLVNEVEQPGYYEVGFNASGLASGVYFCRIMVDGINPGSSMNYTHVNKMMLLK